MATTEQEDNKELLAPQEVNSKYQIADMFQKNDMDFDENAEPFDLINERSLAVKLDGKVFIIKGSMVAYTGEIKFTRAGLADHGVGKAVKRLVTSETPLFTRAEGKGNLVIAEMGKKVKIIRLNGEKVIVNGKNLLAFQDSVEWDIKFMKKAGAFLATGLFNVLLTGYGYVAVATHYDPIIIRLDNGKSVHTDPDSTVLWSANFTPKIKVDVSAKTFIGLSSGESFQMAFDSEENGDGYVLVQPCHNSVFSESKQ